MASRVHDEVLLYLAQNNRIYFKPGEIARALGVHPWTVVRALHQLTDEGFEIERYGHHYRLAKTGLRPEDIFPELYR